MKIDRALVHAKYGGRCGYCGKEITLKQMQADHIVAHWHSMSEADCNRLGIVKGSNDISNMMPACIRCNKWKSTFPIDDFRREIQLQIERLNKYNPNYRIAKDYGLLTETPTPIKFYFETQ